MCWLSCVVCCLLLVGRRCRWLFACCWLLAGVVRCLLCVAMCLLVVVCCLVCVVCCVLFAVWYVLRVGVGCSLFVVRCVLCVACSLFVVRCVLVVAC